MLMIVKIYPKH